MVVFHRPRPHRRRAGQGDEPRRRGDDADSTPQAVAGHDLGRCRGLEMVGKKGNVMGF